MDTVSSLIDRSTTLHLRLLECERVLSFAVAYANKRWSGADQSFLDTEQHGTNRKHVINSSTALITLSRCPETFPLTEIDAFSEHGPDRFKQVGRFFSDPAIYNFDDDYWISKDLAAWSPYTSALAIQALFESAKYFEESTNIAHIAEQTQLARIVVTQCECLRKYLKAWAHRVLPPPQQDFDHAFFAYTALETLHAVQRICPPDYLNRIVRKGQPDYSLQAVLDVGETLKQITSDTLERFTLELYRQMTCHFAKAPQYLDVATLALSLYSISTYAEPGRRLPDDIADAALDAIFQLQQPGGLWDTGTPLLGAATGLVGCSSIELANCLLRLPRTIANFEKYITHFDKLLTRIVKGISQVDPANGWATEIRRNGDARQTWYGFLVFEQLTLLSQAIGQHIADLLLKSFQYKKPKPQIPWERLADYKSFKLRIEDEIISPRLSGDISKAKYSFILFGPPGTGKTSIASALAHKLDWGLVEIGPGDFLANGLDGLFAQGDSIFQRLLLLENVVVLFDEIDELVSVRDTNSENFNRFVTTYMLPWLQRLRDKATIIFIFATNHIERFDPAIKRPGRFDLVLPVGPPQGVERVALMTAAGLTQEVAAEISANIPEQATLGEILSAIRDFRKFDATEAKAKIVERLHPDRLLLKPRQWQDFLDASKTY